METPQSQSAQALETIREAARQHRTVIIAYTDSKGVTTQREVEPYEEKGDGIYAYCYSRAAIRKFNREGIAAARMTSKTFAPKWEIKIQ